MINETSIFGVIVYSTEKVKNLSINLLLNVLEFIFKH